MIAVIQPRLWGGCGFGSDKQAYVYIKGDEPRIGANITESSKNGRSILVDSDILIPPVQSFVDFPPGWTASWAFIRADRQYLYLGGVPGLVSRPFTLECWAKITLDTGFDQLMLQTANNLGNGVEFGARANNAWVKILGVKVMNIPAIVVYGTWQLWRLVRDDSNNLRLYVDGLLIGSVVVGDFGSGQILTCACGYADRSVCMTGSLSAIRFSYGYCRYRSRTFPLIWPTRKW